MKERTIESISNFIFIEDRIEPANLIMIPGSSKWEVSEKGAQLYSEGFASRIVVAGKYSPKNGRFHYENIKGSKYDGNYSADYEFCKAVLTENGVPSKSIICETESMNTYENAIFSRNVLQITGVHFESAILCCQAFHARRALMTYELAFPEIDFFVVPIVTQGISKENWYKSEKGIKRVLGEIEKIGKYFAGYYTQDLQ